MTDKRTTKIRELAESIGYGRMRSKETRKLARQTIAASTGYPAPEIAAALRADLPKTEAGSVSDAIVKRAHELGWETADKPGKASIRLQVGRELSASRAAIHYALEGRKGRAERPGRPREHPSCPTCGQSLRTPETRERVASAATIPVSILADREFLKRVRRRVGPMMWSGVTEVFSATLHAIKTLDRDDPMKPKEPET
jgi:hypothetical protein